MCMLGGVQLCAFFWGKNPWIAPNYQRGSRTQMVDSLLYRTEVLYVNPRSPLLKLVFPLTCMDTKQPKQQD